MVNLRGTNFLFPHGSPQCDCVNRYLLLINVINTSTHTHINAHVKDCGGFNSHFLLKSPPPLHETLTETHRICIAGLPLYTSIWFDWNNWTLAFCDSLMMRDVILNVVLLSVQILTWLCAFACQQQVSQHLPPTSRVYEVT